MTWSRRSHLDQEVEVRDLREDLEQEARQEGRHIVLGGGDRVGRERPRVPELSVVVHEPRGVAARQIRQAQALELDLLRERVMGGS